MPDAPEPRDITVTAPDQIGGKTTEGAAGTESDVPVIATVGDTSPASAPAASGAIVGAYSPEVEQLQRRKLLLEIKDLEEKTAWRGRTFTYGKTIFDVLIPIAAIAGLVFTVNTTHHQWQSQSRDNLNARFQAGYSALGSQTASQRITGAHLLGDLMGTDASRDTEVLRALVDSLALDVDPNVRMAINRVLTQNNASKQAKSEALNEIIYRQNGLENASGLSHLQIGMAYKNPGGWVIPYGSRISWKASGQEIFDSATAAEDITLDQLTDLGLAFMATWNSGGRTKMMSGLYMANFQMDIFSKEEVADANFQSAILPFCTFSKARLPKANFSNAFLIGASFPSAQLPGAHFADTDLDNAGVLARSEIDWRFMLDTANHDRPYFLPLSPMFQDTNLEGASFSGNLFTIARLPSSGREIALTLLSAFFERADLKRVNFEGASYTIVRFTPRPIDQDPSLIEYVASDPRLRGRMAIFGATSTSFDPGRHRVTEMTVPNEASWPDADSAIFARVLSAAKSLDGVRLPGDFQKYFKEHPRLKTTTDGYY